MLKLIAKLETVRGPQNYECTRHKKPLSVRVVDESGNKVAYICKDCRRETRLAYGYANWESWMIALAMVLGGVVIVALIVWVIVTHQTPPPALKTTITETRTGDGLCQCRCVGESCTVSATGYRYP